MNINKNTQSQVTEIMDATNCSKDFECYRTNFEKMCKVKSFGAGNLYTCLDENKHSCGMSLLYGDVYFCKCPVRLFVAKKLKK